MKKIIVVSSLLVMFIFLVACAPQEPLTDEELEAELAKLTPEERAALLKDLESKEKSAFAGQAIASKYKISSKVARSSVSQVMNLRLPCRDNEKGKDPFVAGVVQVLKGEYDSNGEFVYAYTPIEDWCGITATHKNTIDPNFGPGTLSMAKPDKSCKDIEQEIRDFGFYDIISVDECYVIDHYCQNGKGGSQVYEKIACPDGCQDGACLGPQAPPGEPLKAK